MLFKSLTVNNYVNYYVRKYMYSKKNKIKKIELSGPKTLFGFKAIADKMYYFSKSAV